MIRLKCQQCGEKKYVKSESGLCDECLSENSYNITQINDLIRNGHTEHCAKRQIYGDGECECGKVIDIEKNLPHKVSETVCLKCLEREINVRPISVPLKMLECGNCGEVGYVIETGEEFNI